MREHILHATGLDSSSGRILEVGCGTGAILQSLAGSSSSTLYGLDHKFEYLQETQTTTAGARLTCGDAYHLPFASDSMDAALSHFLFLWLAEPMQVLREMLRVVKSGGWVIAFAEPDYSGRIDHPAALQTLGEYQSKALRQQGANPSIGRSLRGLFAQAGLQNIQAGLISGHWGTAFDAVGWQQEWETLQSDLENTIPQAELEHLKAVDLAAWQNGERILYVPTFYAWGQAP
jgi:ubiquinone/menaquinone biosynthesis C-methylase UbiE